MEIFEKKNILQDVLTEYGYAGWYVIKPTKLIPANCFLLFNPKEKKISEVSIREDWLDDPHRRSAIGELLVSTIQTCGYILPRAHLSLSITGAEHQSNALGEKDHKIEYRKTTVSRR
jgi:hypothetical protein